MCVILNVKIWVKKAAETKQNATVAADKKALIKVVKSKTQKRWSFLKNYDFGG